MSLITRITDLTTRIGTEIKAIRNQLSGNSTGDLSALTTSNKGNLLAAINELNSDKLETSLKGANNGLAELDGSGTVPSSQLPSFVDDVVECANAAARPATGETGKIYVTLDNGLTFRWSGSAYVEISSSLALGSTGSTAAPGNHDHDADYANLNHGDHGIGAHITTHPAPTTRDSRNAAASHGDHGVAAHAAAHPAPTNRDTRNQIAGSYAAAHTHPYRADTWTPVYNGIRDGQINTSPSEDAVFDALAGKAATHSHPYAATNHGDHGVAAHAASHPAPTNRDTRNEAADTTIIKESDVDDVPVNGVTTKPVSSNWAYDHKTAHPAPTNRDTRNAAASHGDHGVAAHAASHPAPTVRDTRNQVAGSYAAGSHNHNTIYYTETEIGNPETNFVTLFEAAI
jgi:hypothetical protein